VQISNRTTERYRDSAVAAASSPVGDPALVGLTLLLTAT
jgi:hypothetical protein